MNYTKEFRNDISVSCSSCGGIEMKYDPHYLSFRCSKCKTIISMKIKKVLN